MTANPPPPVVFSKEVQAELQRQGINSLHAPGSVAFLGSSILEPPCSLKWLIAEERFEIGAFSYAVNGYFFATTIGRYCSIGEQVQVGRHSHPLNFSSTSPLFYWGVEPVLGSSEHEAIVNSNFQIKRPPTILKRTMIGNDVYIGHGAFIMPGVTIGNGAVIGAMSVVTKDVPDYAIVAGSPARVIRKRFEEPVVTLMMQSKWWRYSPAQLAGADASDPLGLATRALELEKQGVAPYQPERQQLIEMIQGLKA
jgi:acetyltransferase-like isoleucine patch superfamily enzyme